MMKKDRNICVLDIKNVHDEYSYALEFIDTLENIQSESEYPIKLDAIRNIARRISVRGGKVQAGVSAIYYEKPIESKEPKTGDIVKKEYLIDKLRMLKDSMFDSKMMPFFTNKEMLYHIRIHIEERNGNFSNLQYLALLLQKLSFMFEGLADPKKRLSVFIVPASADKYPFLDEKDTFDSETYINASKYLQLLSKEYKGVIFGAMLEKNNKVDVRALDYKITTRPGSYFPLIPMNEKNYSGLFDKSVSAQTLNDVFALVKNSRKRNYNSQDRDEDEEEFYNYIAESSFRNLERKLDYLAKEEKEKFLADILKILTAENAKVYWISFALFCFMFQKTDAENVEMHVWEMWKLVQNLFDGIKQIAQNAVQHSEKRSGVFSFYMQATENLTILISDLNYSKSIRDKLMDTLEAEYEDCEDEERKKAILNLTQKREINSLRNLFGEFGEDDPKEEWKEFRKQNSSAHVGLMLFGVTTIRCNAKINVHSCTSYRLQNPRDSYCYQCLHSESKECANRYLDKRVIPGTQYSIEIPIIPMQKISSLGLGQIKNNNCMQEDYETFAEYLDYKEKELECATSFSEISYTLIDKSYTSIARKKLSVIKQWKAQWKEILNVLCNEGAKESLYYIDMSMIRKSTILADTDDTEIFIKSFFEAIVDMKNLVTPALALTNVDYEFMRVFKDICIVFSARKFPENFQLFVCAQNYTDSLILCGETFYEAIHNGYLLAIEHGTRELGVFEYARVRELYYKINNINEKSDDKKMTKIKVLPFDTILSCDENKKVKIFDNRITQMAEAEIEGDIPGYRIGNTHMRLGSKVHIQSFYEMSFLFYRTSIANRIAFEILKNLIEGKSFSNLNVIEDTLLFYGYASYSKAILTSIVEILNIYRRNKGQPSKAAFVSYQHNLQSDSDDVQMYYGFSEGFSAQVENNTVIVKEPIKVVQIVPISSTLTTFEKMWERLKRDVLLENSEQIQAVANYSVYWVMHTDEQTEEGKPSPLEGKYWWNYDVNEHLITTKFKGLHSKIYYFIRRPVMWHNPLSCSLCYPQNLLDEVPLVETDQTSTVPTQQIRKKKKTEIKRNVFPNSNERFLKLKDSIVYGHIKRGKNHFQYYIDTQSYFYNVRDMVREWLEECREKDERNAKNVDFPCIHVIFSPEHNTNVGFAQYVNTYYFGGMAEVVAVNEDKEFRSNFECEHTALMHTIERLLSNVSVDSLDDMPVRFHFADDTIISGESFQKANSFLRTLLPVEYKQRFSSNIISKCFLLVDRMSNDTKRNYVVNVERDFYSFLHIDVSNVRTQGDSCIGCKLEKDSIRLFKRSSTNYIATYWCDKVTEFEPVSYDNKEEIKRFQTEQAFHRLLISHVSQNVIFMDNDAFEYGSVYDSILAIAFRLLDCNVVELKKRVNISYDKLIDEVKGIDSISLFFKIISRPFFSFDFRVKLQVLTLLIALTEILLGNEKKIKEYKCESELVRKYKNFLLEKNRIVLTVRLGKLLSQHLREGKQVEFIQKCLIRCLADMRSTYLLRQNTIANIYNYLSKKDKIKKDGGNEIFEHFWRAYANHIHYVVDCSSDEMRSLGLEYLLLTGKEYREFIGDAKKNREVVFPPMFLYESITGKKVPKKRDRDSFYIFCHELLLQNTRIHFDGLEKDSKRQNGEDTYYMEQWSCVRYLEQFKVCGIEDYPENLPKMLPTEAERKLFEYLKKENDNTSSLQEVKDKYENLLKKISSMIQEKHGIPLKNIRMALLTLNENHAGQPSISDLDILTDINAQEASERYDIKNRIVTMLDKNEIKEFELDKDGYAISESKKNTPHMVVYFKNQHNTTENSIGRTMRTIAKVMLYISIEVNTANESFYYSRFVLRDLMAYKNRLMRMLETDFASDMFTKYAHTTDEKNIFAHEKAINHSSIRDNDELQMLLEKHTVSEKYDVLGYDECIKWLTLKNYVNEQIARLFNRCFRMQSEDMGNKNGGRRMEAPQLYIGEKEREYLSENPFCRKLKYFRELNFLQDDRFVLLMDVVNIEYKDLMSAEIVTRTEEGSEKAYNQEYMKCLILDILFSALKKGSYRPGFLEKINWYIKGKIWISANGMLDDEEMKELQDEQCIVKIYREKCQEEGFDYLVFQNRVALTIPNLEDANRDILRRLQDPLDYPDGHMSLLTIKKYIEGLKAELENKTVFEYEMQEDVLVFNTKLPILKKGVFKNEKDSFNR